MNQTESALLGFDDDACLMLYSSGTTGRPKGVVHTHANLASSVRALQAFWRFTPDDVLVTSGGPAAAVAANDGTASNHSDGTASITTGAAHAVGNSATTTVAQTSGGALASQGAVYIVERSSVVNAGLGAANTGLNAAVGNTLSNSAARTHQYALEVALDKLNNNLNFMSPTPCPVTYP